MLLPCCPSPIFFIIFLSEYTIIWLSKTHIYRRKDLVIFVGIEGKTEIRWFSKTVKEQYTQEIKFLSKITFPNFKWIFQSLDFGMEQKQFLNITSVTEEVLNLEHWN